MNISEQIVKRHDSYMKALLLKLKEIIQTQGKEAAQCILFMHEGEGDPNLVDSDWDLLKEFVNNDKYQTL